jgi:Protein of unknown function (DUF1360)
MMGFGLVYQPRATRVVAGIFAIEAVSDFLQLAYDATKKAGK